VTNTEGPKLTRCFYTDRRCWLISMACSHISSRIQSQSIRPVLFRQPFWLIVFKLSWLQCIRTWMPSQALFGINFALSNRWLRSSSSA